MNSAAKTSAPFSISSLPKTSSRNPRQQIFTVAVVRPLWCSDGKERTHLAIGLGDFLRRTSTLEMAEEFGPNRCPSYIRTRAPFATNRSLVQERRYVPPRRLGVAVSRWNLTLDLQRWGLNAYHLTPTLEGQAVPGMLSRRRVVAAADDAGMARGHYGTCMRPLLRGPSAWRFR